MSDCYAITANVVSDKALRTGSRVWVLSVPGIPETVLVAGLSKGGRRLPYKWMATKRLTNVRVKYLPEGLREGMWLKGPKDDPRLLCEVERLTVWGGAQ